MPQKLSAIIMAAGQGTRMKSNLAKVLHRVGGEPMVNYPIRLCLDAGVGQVVLVVGHQAEAVQESTDASFAGIARYALQKEQKGTGHAVREGMKALSRADQVLILSGDVPLLRLETVRGLLRMMTKRKLQLGMITTLLDDPFGYGRVVRDAKNQLTGIVEHKDATDEQRQIREINAGIYCVEMPFLKKALKKLKNNNAAGEYYLTDIVGLAIRKGLKVGAFIAPDSGEVQGANNRGQLAELNRNLYQRIADRHMVAGVTIVDPAATYIGDRVKIGKDTVIEPGVHLRGETTIGSACSIDTGCVVQDSRIGNSVTINAHTLLENAVVKRGAVLGPFARLRPGAEILEEAKVGNFVELKKTTLGRGAKANHLAYLGDAKIGAGANVGAGTITCNYDGYGKYVTDIGPGVFVGSNSTLVAPVVINKGAYVAAGSTVTDAVGADDLAFGRARQLNKPGRAKALRRDAEKRAAAAKRKSGGKPSKKPKKK